MSDGFQTVAPKQKSTKSKVVSSGNFANSTQFEGQDWKPTIIRKKLETKKDLERQGKLVTVPKFTTNRNTQQYIRDDEEAPPLTYGSDLGRKLAQFRANHETLNTQVLFAAACNMTVSQISAYEKGTAVYNSNQVNAMARALGVHLERPKKK